MHEDQNQRAEVEQVAVNSESHKAGMRILIPILGFAPQGGYRVLSELANAWIQLGHECTFLTPSTSADPYFPTNAKILRCDWRGRFRDRPSTKRARGYDNILSLLAGLRRIGSDHDVIFANHSLTAWPVFLANCSKAKKIYYIQAFEPEYYAPLKTPFKHLLARGSYLLGLRQITNSDTYRGWGLNPEAAIPPGIDLRIFTLDQSSRNFRDQKIITLGTIGRAEPHKGTATALAAYRILRQDDPRLQLRVAFGNVPPSDDIEIVPIKGDVQLAAFYRSLDLLIVSCRGQHGAPHYPLIEAMASGVPVVHTGYFPGHATNSWQATNSGAEAVAEAIRNLLQAPEIDRTKRIAAARETVEQNLSWTAVAMRFEPFFYD